MQPDHTSKSPRGLHATHCGCARHASDGPERDGNGGSEQHDDADTPRAADGRRGVEPNGDGDGDEPRDAGAERDPQRYVYRDAASDCQWPTYGNPDAKRYADGNSDWHRNRYADGNSDWHRNRYANRDTNEYGHVNCNINGYGHVNSNINERGHVNRDANEHGHVNCNADHHADVAADRHTHGDAHFHPHIHDDARVVLR